MGLLITDSNKFEIEIAYVEEGQTLTFLAPDSQIANVKKERFTFKRPNWREDMEIMSASVIFDGARTVVNPFRVMDMRIRRLLKDWTLVSGEKKLEINPENIDNLHPDLVQELYRRLEKILSPSPEEQA